MSASRSRCFTAEGEGDNSLTAIAAIIDCLHKGGYLAQLIRYYAKY